MWLLPDIQTGAPYVRMPDVADEGAMPPYNAGPSIYPYVPVVSTTIQPEMLYMNRRLRGMRFKDYQAAVLGGADAMAEGGACCIWAQNGGMCRHRMSAPDFLFSGYGYGSYGYPTPAVDWPSVSQKMGFGPGPILQFADVFPLRGRQNLAPFRGY